MQIYFNKWSKGATPEAWDEPDKAKVRHMLNRGKSIDFIRDYTGMPVHVIESVQRNMNPDGSRRGRDKDRLPSTINNLNSADPIAPDYSAMMREERDLSARNRAFVAAVNRARAAQLERETA